MGAGVALSVPIAFAFGLASVAYLQTLTSTPLSLVVSRMDEGMSTLVLLSVPLFVFLGLLIEMTGMAGAMIRCLASLVGHIRGGLCYVLLGAMYLVSGISGAKAADMAAVAPALLPEMKRRGMKESELVALLAASSAMSETIPPSLVLITIGSVTGVSIAALFTGGLMPALVLAIALAVLARWRARNEDTSKGTRASTSEVVRSFVIALPALVLPFLIRAAAVEGVATATEVSTIGIAYCVLAGILIYRRFDWRRLYPMLVETACLSGAILLIIGTATAMGWILTQSGFSRHLALLHLWQDDRRFRGARKRARGHPCYRCLWPLDVSERPTGRHQRDSLCDGCHPRYGHRPLRSTRRCRVLCGMCDRAGRSGCSHEGHLALSRRAATRSPACGRSTVVFDRVSATLGFRGYR